MKQGKDFMIEFLKDLFGGQALTIEQLAQAVNTYNQENKDKAFNIVNLADGKYISVDKYNAKVKELDTANTQIATLNQTVKTHEGDNAALNQKMKDMQKEYDKNMKSLKDGHAKTSALNQWFGTHKTKYEDLIRGKFDMEKLVVSDDGTTVTGIEEQGKALLEQYKDLFTPQISGHEPRLPQSGFKAASFDDLVKNADNMTAEEVAAQFAEMSKN